MSDTSDPAPENPTAAAERAFFALIFTIPLLFLCLAVHLSTFTGIDLLNKYPSVMWIHLLIFIPAISAIMSANSVAGPPETRQQRAMHESPRWLGFLMKLCVAYTIFNFVMFFILSEGGGPEREGNRFILSSHGKFIRELTEQEFHRHQAYVLRGFSGHWILFCIAAIYMLVGVIRLTRKGQLINRTPPTKVSLIREHSAELAKLEPRLITPIQPHTNQSDKQIPSAPVAGKTALLALVSYVLCLIFIFSGSPFLNFLAAIPIVISAIAAFRQKSGFPNTALQSGTGCLSLLPNIFATAMLGRNVLEFVYFLVFVGLDAAVNHNVSLQLSKFNPHQLSTGELVDGNVISALMVFVQFPLTGLGFLGLTRFAEVVGRSWEVHSDRYARRFIMIRRILRNHLYPPTATKARLFLALYLFAVIGCFSRNLLFLLLVEAVVVFAGIARFMAGPDRSRPSKTSALGCLVMIPNLFFAILLGICAAGFLVYCVEKGPQAAWTSLFTPEISPSASDAKGTSLSVFLIGFPSLAFLTFMGSTGLNFLINYFASYWQPPPPSAPVVFVGQAPAYLPGRSIDSHHTENTP